MCAHRGLLRRIERIAFFADATPILVARSAAGRKNGVAFSIFDEARRRAEAATINAPQGLPEE